MFTKFNKNKNIINVKKVYFELFENTNNKKVEEK